MSNRVVQLKIFIVANLFLILAIIFTQTQPSLLLSLILIFYVFIFALIDQKIGLFLIILFRPSLDIFTNNQVVSVGYTDVNATSVIGILSIILALILIIKNKAQRPPMFKAWLLFLGISLITILFSIDKAMSIKEIVRLLSIFFFYLSSFYLIKKNKDFVLLVKTIILSAIIPGMLATYQYFTNTGLSIPMENIYNRIYGTFAHPNLFAYYLVIPITLAILIFLIGKKEKVINIAILLLSMLYIFLLGLTYTRGAWLAFVLIVLIIGILRYRTLLISAVIIFIFSYFFITPINTRIDDLYKARQGNSIEWRKNLWNDALDYVAERPINGYGVGTANKLILEKRGEKIGSSDPHNDYLKITLESGLLGLFGYLLLSATTLFYFIKNYFKIGQEKLKTVNLIVFALLSSLLIMSFADNILRNTALQWALWSLIGGLAGISYQKMQKNKVENIVDKQKL